MQISSRCRNGHIPSKRCRFRIERDLAAARCKLGFPDPHASPLATVAQNARLMTNWWSQSGSNRRPDACKATALPAELWPHSGEASVAGGHIRALRLSRHGARQPVGLAERFGRLESKQIEGAKWWAWDDSNVRPHPYQGCALTT